MEGHQRQGKRFVPPLMQFDNLVEHSWHEEMLPDFLWLALMLGRRFDWEAAYRPLRVVDRFVPEGRRFADGRLTGFGLVPDDARADARIALRTETPHALPAVFGHVLGLFPSCPAYWLYEDWLQENDLDIAAGLRLARDLIADNTDKYSVRATRLRMAALSRRIAHGKLFVPRDGSFALFPDYPHGLSAFEQRQVESVARASWISSFGVDAAQHPEHLTWPADFWRRCRELTPCVVTLESEEIPVQHTPDGPVDPEPLMHASELHALLVAVQGLGDDLRQAQLQAFSDPSSDHATTVLMGFASRLYRLTSDFLERPSAWAPSTAALHLRPIVEARIVSAWLARRNDLALFAAYREHGLGHLKLLRDHIKADLGADLDEEARRVLEYLDRRVNLERDEWFQPVNVGSFTDVSIRDMAIETDLKRIYDLSYVPYSSTNHGEWPTIRENDTMLCEEPLHRAHRVGAFATSDRRLGPQPAQQALAVAEEGITELFAHYDIDVSGQFPPVWKAFDAAMYEPSDESSDA